MVRVRVRVRVRVSLTLPGALPRKKAFSRQAASKTPAGLWARMSCMVRVRVRVRVMVMLRVRLG